MARAAIRFLSLGLVLAWMSACAPAPGHNAQPTLAKSDYQLPTSPKKITVLVDRIPGQQAQISLHGWEVAIALRHFTVQTTWMYADQLTAAAADAVVYLGIDPAPPIPPRTLDLLRHSKTLIVQSGHLRELHARGIAFTHVRQGSVRLVSANARLKYRNRELAVRQQNVLDVRAARPAKVLATLRDGKRLYAYAVQDGRATFINGPIDFDQLEAYPVLQAEMIATCDLLSIGLHAAPVPNRHIAMLRLEDVSVQTQAVRLRAIVNYLTSSGIPYGIGVIPDQLIKGKTLSTLSQDPELVAILRFAQDHGARIILHGLHHSYNSPEDYEFFDAVHFTPLPQDSVAWMRGKVLTGLHIEQSLGLRPLFWETPHYAASQLDYRTVDTLFTASWEQRRPVFWLPWVLQRDEYGALLLPEDLGYISYGGDDTLAQQLQMAADLLLCRQCIAAGFLHPSTVTLSDVRGYVEGLQSLGYVFADPAGFLPAGARPS